MEDISRELEREIARSKPKPYKKELKTRLLIVDDFGQMESAEYFKVLVKLLSVISLVCFVAAVVFSYLYVNLSKNSDSIKAKLDIAQKTVNELTQEKEVLMAKLVISGSKLDVVPKPLVAEKREIKPVPLEPEPVEKKEDLIKPETVKPETVKKVKPVVVPTSVKPVTPIEQDSPIDSSRPTEIVDKTVTIENFIVKKARSNKDLLVRFDIRKISNKPGDVAGRIFTVLRPGNASEEQLLVVPSTPLKNGIPSEYKKGQYFSIAHFKPVKFKIKNQESPDFFKKASIFIFNDKEELIFEKLINISEAQ